MTSQKVQNAEPRDTEGPRPGALSRGKGAATGKRGRPKGSTNKPKSLVPVDLAETLLLAMRDQLPKEHFEYVKGVVKDGKAVSSKNELQTLILLLSRNLWAALIDEMRPPEPDSFEDAVEFLQTTGRLHDGGQALVKARERIIERDYGIDGPICGRCGEGFDLSLNGLHPDGLTVGHIVPVARGGSDDDSNLRPEHRRCNLAVQERRPQPAAPVFRRDVTDRLKVLSSLLNLLHQIEKKEDDEKDQGDNPLVKIWASRGMQGRVAVLINPPAAEPKQVGPVDGEVVEGTAREV